MEASHDDSLRRDNFEGWRNHQGSQCLEAQEKQHYSKSVLTIPPDTPKTILFGMVHLIFPEGLGSCCEHRKQDRSSVRFP